jgi:hypothetical protein
VIPALLLAALAPFVQQDGQTKGPDPARVAEVRLALEEAFRSGDEARIREALEATRSLPEGGLVKLVARGLADPRKDVRLATLMTLRWIEHKAALECLERAWEERKRWKDPELDLAVLRGIGQHASPSSVALLARDPFDPSDHACWRARIFGLARIRSRPALEALFTLLGATSGAGVRRVQPLMADVRVALILMTSVDQGLAPERWERWWRENKKDFRIAPEEPLLPAELREPWDRFWGLSTPQGHERRREDRGREPRPPNAR